MSVRRFCSILIGCGMMLCSQAAGAGPRTPEDLARLWVEAITENSTTRMRALIHPGCPQDSISPEILARMVQGGMPEKYQIETRPLGPRAELEKIYQVVPDSQLTLKFLTGTPEDKVKYGLGKGFPIAKASEQWFFVICTRPG